MLLAGLKTRAWVQSRRAVTIARTNSSGGLLALGATIYTFDIELADSDRAVYQSLNLRVAQHPSETPDYLLTRVLAYCLEYACLLYTSDAADERSSVDLGGRRIIK